MPKYKNFHKHITYHPPSRRRHWLWWVGSIGIVLIIAFFIIRAYVSQPAQSEAAGAPRLSIAQDTFDYGNVKLGTTVETVFRVRNTGDKPLLILNQPRVQIIEGCCPPNVILSSSVIKPGQEATVTLNFMMHEGMGGKHRFHIDLQTNDPTQPHKLLVVLSNWV